MQVETLFRVMRIASSVILVLMAAAIAYAGIIGIMYWSGIGV